MKKLVDAIFVRSMAAVHYLLSLVLFIGFWQLFYAVPGISDVQTRAIVVIYATVLFLLSRIYHVYGVGLVRVGEIVYSQILANLISLGITYMLACVLKGALINPLAGAAAAVIQAFLCAAWTIGINRWYFTTHKPKQAVVVYRERRDLQKLEEICRFEQRWNILKKIQWKEEDVCRTTDAERTSVRDIHTLIPMIADCAVVFVSGVSATMRNGIVKYCIETGKDCFFVPHTGDVIIAGAQHVSSFAVPICRARRGVRVPEYLIVKRLVDIVFSLIGIVVLGPFMLITALAVKCYDGGPVLYRQVRLTEGGKLFQILKFRSMRTDAEKDGVARLASDQDDRITPVGKIIRAIRFDELPQLFNILLGDMSIVGPRPERPEIAEQYEKVLPAFSLRLQVKAGLTGYAQVYGRYNTEPADKLKMDLMYIKRISLVEDVTLILATIRVLFMKESTSGVEQGQMTAVKETDESV